MQLAARKYWTWPLTHFTVTTFAVEQASFKKNRSSSIVVLTLPRACTLKEAASNKTTSWKLFSKIARKRARKTPFRPVLSSPRAKRLEWWFPQLMSVTSLTELYICSKADYSGGLTKLKGVIYSYVGSNKTQNWIPQLHEIVKLCLNIRFKYMLFRILSINFDPCGAFSATLRTLSFPCPNLISLKLRSSSELAL